MLLIPDGYYLVGDLHFDKTGSITVMGSSKANNACCFKYTGSSYCFNIHGCVHLRFENFAIVNNGNGIGAIRLYDKDATLTSGYTDSRCGDINFNHLKLIGFSRGISFDGPSGYINVNEIYIEGIPGNGYGITIGENYHYEHHQSGRYAVFPSYIYISKVYASGQDWVDNRNTSPIAALIGLFSCHQIFISQCDLCNLGASEDGTLHPAIYGNNQKGEILDIQLSNNYFFNVQNSIVIEKVNNTYPVAKIHSKGNHYFVGHWTDSTPFTLKAISSDVNIYGFSSVGDVFDRGNGTYKYLYDFSYVRNVTIENYTVMPDISFYDLWTSGLYNFKKVTNITGTKNLTLSIPADATTDASGCIKVNIPANLWEKHNVGTYIPFVLSNLHDGLNAQYNITCTAITDETQETIINESGTEEIVITPPTATLRFRSIKDGSALTNTKIPSATALRIMLTGI